MKCEKENIEVFGYIMAAKKQKNSFVSVYSFNQFLIQTKYVHENAAFNCIHINNNSHNKNVLHRKSVCDD